MNKILDSVDVFQLKDLVDYKKEAINKVVLLVNDQMKFVLMAFDEGCALAPHTAPGNAIVFGLEGKGTITYEGKEYSISAGQNFRFKKDALHAVRANGPFKMGLLLEL